MRELPADVLSRLCFGAKAIYPKVVTKLNSADGARKSSSAGNFGSLGRGGIRGDRYFIPLIYAVQF
ncbi:MAG: hypothetical protein V7L31_32320 [Nostoc sp.]|uniref:hypothetical protein n=1 Tax=Nostoc sp. TaxID=1180 RepID=UPI002FF11892